MDWDGMVERNEEYRQVQWEGRKGGNARLEVYRYSTVKKLGKER